MSSVVDEISSLLKENDLTCFESESESHSVVSNSLQPHGLYSPWNSLGQNTGVGSLLLLQGIFPTQGTNLGLPPCRQILYQLSHKGSPRSCFKYIIIWEDPISSVVTDVFFFFFNQKVEIQVTVLYFGLRKTFQKKDTCCRTWACKGIWEYTLIRVYVALAQGERVTEPDSRE